VAAYQVIKATMPPDAVAWPRHADDRGGVSITLDRGTIDPAGGGTGRKLPRHDPKAGEGIDSLSKKMLSIPSITRLIRFREPRSATRRAGIPNPSDVYKTATLCAEKPKAQATLRQKQSCLESGRIMGLGGLGSLLSIKKSVATS
jgi:hypothetical protein